LTQRNSQHIEEFRSRYIEQRDRHLIARRRRAAEDGRFLDLLDAAAHEAVVEEHHHDDSAIGSVRRSTTPPPPHELLPTPSLSRPVLHTISIRPEWGLLGAGLFLPASLTGAFGAGPVCRTSAIAGSTRVTRRSWVAARFIAPTSEASV